MHNCDTVLAPVSTLQLLRGESFRVPKLGMLLNLLTAFDPIYTSGVYNILM